jgi:DNA-binding transcriptional ArsR family regulator
VSHQAVTWAMDDAPMLLTDKGKPDTTARHVLQVLAERADVDGRNSYPSVLDVQYRAGYDERTVRRALRRLEQGGLITAEGSRYGCTNWALALGLKRPVSDLVDLKTERDEAKARDTARKQASRKKGATPLSGTETPGHPGSVRDAESRMSGTQNPAVRDGTPPKPSGTVREPFGGTLPPDPLRTESPPTSAPRAVLEQEPEQSKTTSTAVDLESPVPNAGARVEAVGAERWRHVDISTLRYLGTPEALAEADRRAAYRPPPTWRQQRTAASRMDPARLAAARAEMDKRRAEMAEEEAIRRRAAIRSVDTTTDAETEGPAEPYESTG